MNSEDMYSAFFYVPFIISMIFIFIGIPIGFILVIVRLVIKNKKRQENIAKILPFLFVPGPVLWVISVLIAFTVIALMYFKIIPNEPTY